MLPDELYSKHTGLFGAPLAADTTLGIDRMYNTLFEQLLATTFGGLTSEEIRTACIAYYPERFI